MLLKLSFSIGYLQQPTRVLNFIYAIIQVLNHVFLFANLKSILCHTFYLVIHFSSIWDNFTRKRKNLNYTENVGDVFLNVIFIFEVHFDNINKLWKTIFNIKFIFNLNQQLLLNILNLKKYQLIVDVHSWITLFYLSTHISTTTTFI